MSANKYNIREICGDWALDIHWGNKTITLFFNSRNNAELVKSILEWEDNHPNAAVPYKPTLTQPNEPLTLDQLRASPHGKIKDSTLQSICNRANEIACRPPEGEEEI